MMNLSLFLNRFVSHPCKKTCKQSMVLQKITNNRTNGRLIEGAEDHLYAQHEKSSHLQSISCTAKLSSIPHPAQWQIQSNIERRILLGNSNYGIKSFRRPTFARPSLLPPIPIALCRPSSFEDETRAGKVPRNNRGSFIGPAKSRGCLCTTPCAMKQRRSRRWCGASLSSMIITTEPRRNPPPKIPEREGQINGDSVITNTHHNFSFHMSILFLLTF